MRKDWASAGSGRITMHEDADETGGLDFFHRMPMIVSISISMSIRCDVSLGMTVPRIIVGTWSNHRF